jgi:A/G-specific adenine glycosylase
VQPSAETVEVVASKLMEWYARHKRQFPWRVGMRDDWRVLVTAFLLRKTRAETVAKHYDRVLAALSSPEKVLKLGVEGVEGRAHPL